MTSVEKPRLPLAGVKVLEIAHYIAGPYAAMILGDQGAEVVKVERPGGEPARRALPFSPRGESLYYASYNRNKKHVVLDLGNDSSAVELAKLIRWCDIVITNFSIGVPERLGFGYEQVRDINPMCVMIQITGLGSWSKLRDYVAFDGVLQAIGGMADLTGEPDGSPIISNVLVADHVTALQAAFAATLGLQRRGLTGMGSFTEISMARAVGSLLGDHPARVSVNGDNPKRTGNRSANRFVNVFRTADGMIVLNPLTPRMWVELCEEIGRPEWGTDDIIEERRYIQDEVFRSEIELGIGQWLESRSTLAAERILQGRGIACGAVRSVADLIRDDRDLELRMFEEIELASGEGAVVIGRAFDWSGCPLDGKRSVSSLDQARDFLSTLPAD
jgi:crotonobetainyl-CoA:carnitine CoA-transferase CaiB-like acyl-CoA transferase